MSWTRPFSVFSTFINFVDSATNYPEVKPTVVVAGYGWGAHAFVTNIDTRKYNIVVVSERDKRLNQNTMLQSLTPTYTPAATRVTCDTCISIDKEKRTLEGKKGSYTYDYLLVATGSEANDFKIPGVRDYCKMCKTDEDVKWLGSACSAGVTAATILGAGPTGIELACSLKKHGITEVRIIEAAPQILPGFSDTMRNSILKRLEKKGIQLLLNQPIQAVTSTEIKTKYTDIAYHNGELIVWTCGIQPVAFVRALTATGRPLQVNDYLQVEPRIFALGDSVAGRGPPTAQNANQQGAYLANYFNSNFLNKEPYSFKELGRCVDLGDGLLIEVWGFLFFLPTINVSDFITI
jgi:NADH dehydrogenase FAD-containing subunit